MLCKFLQSHSVTVLSLTPSVFRHVLLEAALENVKELGFLRIIALSGEALADADLKKWFEHPHENKPELISSYAITETSGQVAWRRLQESDMNANLLGEVLSDTKVYLLDEKLRPVESGTEGELCVAGPGLASGYLNRAELTAERFIIDPLGDGSEKRLYRTGDRGKMRPDGEIELIGRRDYQVKLNGYRIELREIESVLQAHSAVAESAVLLREDVGSAPRLVGYVVTNQKQASKPQMSELHYYLRRILPDYMVPSVFVFMDKMPLNANGKLDRSMLPAPKDKFQEESDKDLSPISELESTIIEVWKKVLEVESIKVDDNFFFDLEGYSLLAMQVISQLEELLPVKLSMRMVFEAPTVAKLAEKISQLKAKQ